MGMRGPSRNVIRRSRLCSAGTQAAASSTILGMGVTAGPKDASQTQGPPGMRTSVAAFLARDRPTTGVPSASCTRTTGGCACMPQHALTSGDTLPGRQPP